MQRSFVVGWLSLFALSSCVVADRLEPGGARSVISWPRPDAGADAGFVAEVDAGTTRDAGWVADAGSGTDAGVCQRRALTFELVDPRIGSGWGSSIAAGPSREVAIAAMRQTGSLGGDLVVAERTADGGWALTDVTQNPSHALVADVLFTRDGTLHVALHDVLDGYLRYGRKLEKSWEFLDVRERVRAGGLPSLCAWKDGGVAIAHVDTVDTLSTPYALRVTRAEPGSVPTTDIVEVRQVAPWGTAGHDLARGLDSVGIVYTLADGRSSTMYELSFVLQGDDGSRTQQALLPPSGRLVPESPSLAALPDGGWLVAYSAYVPGGSSGEVWMGFVEASGFSPRSVLTLPQPHVAIAATEGGGVVVVATSPHERDFLHVLSGLADGPLNYERVPAPVGDVYEAALAVDSDDTLHVSFTALEGADTARLGYARGRCD